MRTTTEILHMRHEGSSDAEIVALTLKDKDAFALLIMRYEAKLERYVRRLGVRDTDDAHDVLQNIFIKVYRNLNEYDITLPFSSWIYRIAHNEAMTHLRRAYVRHEVRAVPNEDADDLFTLSSDGTDLLEDRSVAYDATLVTEALALLDPKYREILVLRFFEEKGYEEISDILKIPEGTVAVRIHRAKDALQKALNKKLS